MRLIELKTRSRVVKKAYNFLEIRQMAEEKREKGLILETPFEDQERQLTDSPEDLDTQIRQILDSEQETFQTAESEYDQKTDIYALAKQAQADRLVERMDRAITERREDLKQTKKRKPGFIEGIWRNADWKKEVARKEKRIDQLVRKRSAVVRVRSSMNETYRLGLQKMRREEPELARERDRELQERDKARLAAQDSLRNVRVLTQTLTLGQETRKRSRARTLGQENGKEW